MCYFLHRGLSRSIECSLAKHLLFVFVFLQAGEGGEESSDSDGEQEETSHKLIRKVSTSGQIRAKVGDFGSRHPRTPRTSRLRHHCIFKAGSSKVES